MSRLILVAVLLLGLGLIPATVHAQTCSQAPATDAAGQVTITGDGDLNTRPFDLRGGAYTVRWAASPKGPSGGNLMIDLERTDGQSYGDSLVNTILNAGKANGETQVYNLKAGAYYFDVTAPSEWSITISPQ